jgi:CubicO group peptidase (beta-lactamase class C family)
MDRAIVDPGDAGVDRARLDSLFYRIRRQVEGGPLPSAQVAVARHGRLVASRTWGACADARTRYITQSVGRSVVAGAVWKLIGDGLLGTDEPVAEIIPGFGANGKGCVTVEDVLTHTAGFPLAPLGFPKMLDREQRLAAFARWRLDYEPGTRFQFHLTSAGWVIAELVERRTGLALSAYLRERIAGPLGLDSIELGVPVEQQAGSIAPMTATDRRDDQEPDPWGPWYLADPRVLAAGDPSHAVVATAQDLALYYQALRTSGLWRPGAVAEGSRLRFAVVPQGSESYGGGGRRTGMGLFVTVAGPEAGSGMPSSGSPATFGNTGAAYQIGFLDPDSGLSFVLLSNGYPLSGYDSSPRGVAMLRQIADLAAGLVPAAEAADQASPAGR